MTIHLTPNIDLKSISDSESINSYLIEISPIPDGFDGSGKAFWHFKIDQRYTCPNWLAERLDKWLRQMGFSYQGLQRPPKEYDKTHNEVWAISFPAQGSVITIRVMVAAGKEEYESLTTKRSNELQQADDGTTV